MSDDLWITVPNWDKFQHYTDRRPSWIKMYTRLMDDDAYLDLTEHQALILHRLWLTYASSDCHLHVNTASLSRHLHVRVMTRDLEALNHAGFIEFSASKPLAKRYPRDREEKEKNLSLEVSRAKPVRAGRTGENVPTPTGQAAIPIIERMIRNGVIQHPADLDAELSGAKLNSTDADRLRDLLGA